MFFFKNLITVIIYEKIDDIIILENVSKSNLPETKLEYIYLPDDKRPLDMVNSKKKEKKRKNLL